MSKREREKKLREWQKKLELAETASKAEREQMKRREEQYEGSHTIYGVDGKIAKASRATHVRNVSFEVVETQVDSTIPAPKVSAVRREDEELAHIVEVMLRDVMDRLKSERMNDEGERLSPVQGGYGLLVDWMSDTGGVDWLGSLKVTVAQPYSVIPQAGIAQLDDMDFFFLKTPQTKQQVKRYYGVDVTEETEEDPDARQLGAAQDTTDELVTMVTAYYKNEKGGIGRLRWVGDTVLEDMEDYQLRRVHRCVVCGQAGNGRKCTYCGGTKFDEEIMEYEELTEDVVTALGTVIPAVTEERDELGQPVMVETLGGENGLLPQLQGTAAPMVVQRSVTARTVPTRIPYYKPDVFPLVVRKNVSKSGRFWGGSDMDAIFDQQNSLNKVCTKINSKVLGGSSFRTRPEGAKVTSDRDGEWYEVKNPAELEKFRTFNMQAPIDGDMALRNSLYEEARQTIGITDSMQGRKDPTATSAVAKEFSAQQAAGRLESKKVMKRAMYQDLFEVIFKWMLAYCDEPRQVRTVDEHGDTDYLTFDRRDFLYQDEAGEWHYNTDFLFSTDDTAPMATDRQAMWKEMRMNFESGAMGDPSDARTRLRFWEQMEKLHYPMAGDMVKSMREELEEQQMQMQELPTVPAEQTTGAAPAADYLGGAML